MKQLQQHSNKIVFFVSGNPVNLQLIFIKLNEDIDTFWGLPVRLIPLSV